MYWYKRYLAAKLNGVVAEIAEIERQVKITNSMEVWQQTRLMRLSRQRGELEARLERKKIKSEAV